MTDSPATVTSLQDRVILITGATDGIGRALAIRCAELGASVIALGRTQRKLEAVANAVTASNAPAMALVPMDLEKAGSEDFDKLTEAIQANFGRLDALVHNAAMLGERAGVEHHDVAKWLRAMHVNSNVPFILTRHCLPLLRQSTSAAIVFSSCEVAHEAKPHWGPYLVSKWANEGLRPDAGMELAQTRIRVGSVDPGATNTKLRLQAYPGTSHDELPTPEQVIGAYLPWLAAQ